MEIPSQTLSTPDIRKKVIHSLRHERRNHLDGSSLVVPLRPFHSPPPALPLPQAHRFVPFAFDSWDSHSFAVRRLVLECVEGFPLASSLRFPLGVPQTTSPHGSWSFPSVYPIVARWKIDSKTVQKTRQSETSRTQRKQSTRSKSLAVIDGRVPITPHMERPRTVDPTEISPAPHVGHTSPPLHSLVDKEPGE